MLFDARSYYGRTKKMLCKKTAACTANITFIYRHPFYSSSTNWSFSVPMCIWNASFADIFRRMSMSCPGVQVGVPANSI